MLLRYLSVFTMFLVFATACGGGGGGGGSHGGGNNGTPGPTPTVTVTVTPTTPDSATTTPLHIDKVSPVPFITGVGTQNFYVYVTNSGSTALSGIKWSLAVQQDGLSAAQHGFRSGIYSAAKCLLQSIIRSGLSAPGDAINMVNPNTSCPTLGVGQSCKLTFNATGAAIARLSATIDDVATNLSGGGGLIQTYVYTPVSPVDSAHVLSLSRLSNANFTTVPGMDFYIINNSSTDTVMVTKSLVLPLHVSADFSDCPNNLAPQTICPVRLVFENGASSGGVTVTPAGSVNGSALPPQQNSAGFNITNAKIANAEIIQSNNLLVDASQGNPAPVSGVGIIYNSGTANLLISSITTQQSGIMSIVNNTCNGATLMPNQSCTYTPLLNVNAINQSGSANIQVNYNDGVNQNNSSTLALAWRYIPQIPSQSLSVYLDPGMTGCQFGDGTSTTCYANPDSIGGGASLLTIDFNFSLSNIPVNSNLNKVDLDSTTANALTLGGYTRKSSTCDSLNPTTSSESCVIEYAAPASVATTPQDVSIGDQYFTYYAYAADGRVLFRNSIPTHFEVQVVAPTITIESIGAASLGGKKPITIKWSGLFLNNLVTNIGATDTNGTAVPNMVVTPAAPFCSIPSGGVSTCNTYIITTVDLSLLDKQYNLNVEGVESSLPTPIISSLSQQFTIESPIIFMTRESYVGNLSLHDSAVVKTGVGGADAICNQEAHANGSMISLKLSFKALLVDRDRMPCSTYLDTIESSMAVKCGGDYASSDWTLQESEVFYNPDLTVFNTANKYYSFDGSVNSFQYADKTVVESTVTFWFGAPSMFLGDPVAASVSHDCGYGYGSCPNDFVAWTYNNVPYLTLLQSGSLQTQQVIVFGAQYNAVADECNSYTSVITKGLGVVNGHVGVASSISNIPLANVDEWYQYVVLGDNWVGSLSVDDSLSTPQLSNVWSYPQDIEYKLQECSKTRNLVCVSQ